MKTEKPQPIEREDHFSDTSPSDEDRVLGDHLAYFIGDTFIECMTQSPVKQWATIVHALRFHGLRITESPEPRGKRNQ